MTRFGTSQPVRRVEDPRLLRGEGRYIDDLAPKEALHAVFLRSPVAHARLDRVDVSGALAAPGVVAVLTGADLDAGMKNGVGGSAVRNRDGSSGATPNRPAIATDRLRHVGEAIAMVIAATEAEARDAAELIEMEWTELPANADPLAVAEAAELHPEAPGNLAYDWAFGDEAAMKAAFADAHEVVELPLVNNKVIAASMEPRGAFASWDAEAGKLHLAVNGQGVWGLKGEVAARLGLDADKVRVTNPADIGGGFGMKSFNYPEHMAIAYAAKTLGKPVRWMADRSESMLSDVMGRDNVTTIRGAFDKDRRLQALHIDIVSNLGAYNSGYGQFIQSELAKFVAPGVYDVQVILMEVKGVYTNATPVDAYRGAGRPEANYALERLMDAAARQFGMAQEELRRINFIAPEKFPYRTCVGELYDVGNFDKVLTRAMAEADWDGFAARKAEAASRGKLLGRGLCCYIESILGSQDETTRIEFAEDGGLDLYVGTQSNGQGHETVYAQILHQRSGLPFEKIRVRMGDSDLIAKGGGTGGSRSVTMQGNSINAASDEMVEKFRPLAEEELEAPAADLEFSDGAWRVVGTDRAIGLMELSGVARRQGRLELLTTERENTVPGRSYPNGAHVAEVECDPETGRLQVVRYTVADDLGVLMNPMLAEGQVHGGVIQGIGQALCEQVAYDGEAQLLSASFMDYALPRAADMPNVAFFSEPTPSTANAIGMKGCGEAGTVGALAAVTNAALDALWGAGVRHVDMPMTPARVWGWIEAAKTEAA